MTRIKWCILFSIIIFIIGIFTDSWIIKHFSISKRLLYFAPGIIFAILLINFLFVLLRSFKNRNFFAPFFWTAMFYFAGFIYVQVRLFFIEHLVFVNLTPDGAEQANVFSFLIAPFNYWHAVFYALCGLIIDAIIWKIRKQTKK